MPRYIENLNSCTDPGSGDYLWIVDASASSTDKDRKVDVGLFPQLAVANTFTASQTISTGAITALVAASANNGTSNGPMISIGRNTNGTTPAPGALVLGKVNPDANAYLWFDDSGNLRTSINTLITSANRNGGTVVGTQTSSLDSKDVREGVSDMADVLAAVRAGAEAVRRFAYKSGAFGGEEFEGVVVDYAPRYGMDRDAEHPAGKSLNEIVILGDLLRAVAWLVERAQDAPQE